MLFKRPSDHIRRQQQGSGQQSYAALLEVRRTARSWHQEPWLNNSAFCTTLLRVAHAQRHLVRQAARWARQAAKPSRFIAWPIPHHLQATAGKLAASRMQPGTMLQRCTHWACSVVPAAAAVANACGMSF
jgi:hypothetical protein